MEETTLTLNNLFDFSDAALRTELSKVVGATSIAARLAAKTMHFSKESVAGDIAREVARLSNVDVIELTPDSFGCRWRKASALMSRSTCICVSVRWSLNGRS